MTDDFFRDPISDEDNERDKKETSFYYDVPEDYERGAESTDQKEESKPEKKRGFFRMAGKVLALALIFGIVAGVVFHGVNYSAGRLFDRSGSTTSGESGVTSESTAAKDEKETETTPQEPIASVSPVPSSGETDLEAMVEEVMPSIVAVNVVVQTTTQDFFGRTYSRESAGAGSGIIIKDEGGRLYILTNHHVIEDAKDVSVTFEDNSSAKATVMGYKADEDVAVIVVNSEDISSETRSALKVALLGDSDKVKVGSWAIAIGNALGYGQSVTRGIISAVERTVTLTDGTMTLLQTDAAINPGNSGGALLNTSGQVIGVNSVKYASESVEGMGFAIPINRAMEIVDEIIAKGDSPVQTQEKEAFLGIHGGTITESMALQYDCPQGVYISAIVEDSAASMAGLKAGFIITEFDGSRILTMEELTEAIGQHAPGDSVDVKVCMPDVRGYYEEEMKFTVILTEKPEETSTGNSGYGGYDDYYGYDFGN